MNAPVITWQASLPTATGRWFVASRERNLSMQRYWSGAAWSAPCWTDSTDDLKQRVLRMPDEGDGVGIEWCDCDLIVLPTGARAAVLTV
jgi:hypothetical protein